MKIFKHRLATSFLALSAILLTACGPSSSDQLALGSNNPSCPAPTIELTSYTNNLTMRTKPEKGDTIATLQTNYGDIKMFFYTSEAPETARNFIELAKAGKYDNSIFHRVIDCFMVQGGDFENSNGTGGYSYKGPGTSLEDEFGEGLKNIRGAVSMANSGPDTGGSQFFIVQADYGTPWLDGKHAVFAYVYEGMGSVDKIAKVKKGGQDKPLEDVVIEKVTISEFKVEEPAS